MIEIGKDFNMLKQKVKEIGDVEQAGRCIAEDIRDMYEALTSSTFPKAVGALINKATIDAYNTEPTIWQDLVTQVPSNKKTETIDGFTETDMPDDVPEAMPYGETDFGEKYVTISNAKTGRLISVTDETIRFDQTGQIIQRARTIGEKAALKIEKTVVEGVIDANSNVYKPTGRAEALYTTTSPANNDATAFGIAGLTALEKLMDGMQDGRGDPILINRNNLILLTGSTLKVEAWEILNSIENPETAERVKNYFGKRYNYRYSPFITSTTDYFLGDFKKDFWLMVVYPLQMLERNMADTDEGFKRDIIAQFKVRYYMGLGAVDRKHSYKGGS
jgi:hypothetical protein